MNKLRLSLLITSFFTVITQAKAEHVYIDADSYSQPITEINNVLSEHYLTQPNSSKITITLCGDIIVSQSILIGTNTELNACESGATLIQDITKPINSKGYERAFIKFNKSFEQTDESEVIYENITISGLTLNGMANSADEGNTKLNSTMGIVLTSAGLNSPTQFTVKNINIINNHITNFGSNGLIVGNPNEDFFSGNFTYIDVNISHNKVDNLKQAGAAIHVVDETLPELTYSELGHLATYRLDRVVIDGNEVFDTFTDEGNRLHGAGFGILVDAAKHVKVINNSVGNFAEEGIRIYDSNTVLIDNNTVLPSYPLVVGNEFNANGIKFNRVANATISNNDIENTSGPAIELYGTAKVTVTKNTINQTTTHGLRTENYLVLDNPKCQGDNIDMNTCLFRNRYIDIIDNTISHQCGCAINIQSTPSYFDRIEIQRPDAMVNVVDLSDQERKEVMMCNSCG